MRFRLFDFANKIGQADFACLEDRLKIKEQYDDLHNLLDMHAQHEDKAHGDLLRHKKSFSALKVLEDHEKLEAEFAKCGEALDLALDAADAEKQLQYGYDFSLLFYQFISTYLSHLNDEETIIMQELWSKYSDDELRALTFNTYRQMTSEQMIDMLKVLGPYINATERQQFLRDIKDATPEKFMAVWEFMGKIQL
jgi:hypothetical protein